MYKTAEYTSKTANMIKRWYYSTSHWQLVDVIMGNITFFIIFAVFDVLVTAFSR